MTHEKIAEYRLICDTAKQSSAAYHGWVKTLDAMEEALDRIKTLQGHLKKLQGHLDWIGWGSEGMDERKAELAAKGDEIERLRAAAKSVLLFYQNGDWNNGPAQEWKRLTGGREASTVGLCDTVRDALKGGGDDQV